MTSESSDIFIKTTIKNKDRHFERKFKFVYQKNEKKSIKKILYETFTKHHTSQSERFKYCNNLRFHIFNILLNS